MTIRNVFASAALVAALAMPFEASAQTPAPPTSAAGAAVTTPAAPPKTTIPSNGNARRRKGWYRASARDVAAMRGKPVDIVFIGDSVVQHWTREGKAVWEKSYAHRNALLLGVGADKTQDVLWRMDHMDLKQFHPKVSVVMIGTNNEKDTPSDIAAGIQAVVQKTEQTFPGTKVILMSILPTKEANPTMMATNVFLPPMADNRTVFYLDLTSLMTPEGKGWKGIGPDGVHPDAEGYQMWVDAMEPLLTRLLAPEAPTSPTVDPAKP